MLKKQYTFHAIISGLLLCLPWYEHFSGIVLCISFIPLLLLEDSWLAKSQKKSTIPIFLYASISFLIWNTGTTWWIVNASFAGACSAILINTFLFSVVFYLYHITNKIAGKLLGKIAFLAYWTAFEYFYLNAEISWPWLNLGNGFAHDTRLVQWYEYTGALGGTLWVLLANLLIFEIITQLRAETVKRRFYLTITVCLLVLFTPIIISESLYQTYQEKSKHCNIAIVQPNIDPYDNSWTVAKQCSNLIHMSDSLGTASTDYFVAPEISIDDNVWENTIENNHSVPRLQNFIRNFPKASLIYGSYTYKRYSANEPKSVTAQKSKQANFFYDSYNTALQIDTSKQTQLYHKSKLVVGVEKMPYPKTLKFLKKIVEGFGGSFASYGTQNTRTVFESSGKKFKVAPVICYESVYGEYVTEYIQNGANLIFVITNDGWWGNTPGHRQHLGYSCLRAIETRRSIARSANTGISAFINQRGDIIKSLEWGKRGALEGSLNANEDRTFYVKHGDYLGQIAILISGCIALISILIAIKKR